MRSLYESILDSDEKVKKITEINSITNLILSGKAKNKDLDSLKDYVAVWKPKDSDELKDIIIKCTKIDSKCSLNWIDVSDITNMGGMFYNSQFNGDISKWDVDKVTSMISMFYNSQFNGDISKWKVSSKCYTTNMFSTCPIKDKYKPTVMK